MRAALNSNQRLLASNQQPAYGTEVAFIDPMTARKLGTSLLPTDKIVDLSAAERAGITARRWLVDLPKAIRDGIKGNSDYTMADFGLLRQAPYYLGGAFITLSYLAGKDRLSTLQQGLGVLGYYLSFGLARKAVDQLYKARYGVDFGLMYKTPDNRYEPVYGSVSYPRIDLLRPTDFKRMRKKMGIPDDVASPNEAVKHQLPNILSAAWLDRMVLSNAFAAAVTGYITRVASVKGLPRALKSLAIAVRSPRLLASLFSLAAIRAVMPKGPYKGPQRLALILGLGAPLATLLHALKAQTPERYESTGSTVPVPPASTATPLAQQPVTFSAFKPSPEAVSVTANGLPPKSLVSGGSTARSLPTGGPNNA